LSYVEETEGDTMEPTTQQATRSHQRLGGYEAHAPPAVGGLEVPVPALRDREGARQVPAGALLKAIPAWLGLTWLACYVAGPLLLAMTTSDHGNVLVTGILTAPAFFATAMATAVAAAVASPRLRLGKGGFEPVAWAAAGWLAVWALVHNTSMILEPFAQMPLDAFGGFLLLNLLEAGLIGAMLGTLTRSRVKAFGFGAAFQAMQMSLGLSILAALP
jgi:hypothetical protein